MRDESTRRAVLGLAGTTIAVGLAGCSGLTSDGSAETNERADGSGEPATPDGTETPESGGSDPGELSEPTGAVRSAAIPENAADRDYPIAGTGSAGVEATLYGGWKCSYTASFVKGELNDLIGTYVEPGDVDLEFRAVPYDNGEPFHGDDEPGVARAGQAVWNEDPESFWPYFAYLFENQRTTNDWYSAERIRAVADAAGVSDAVNIEAAVDGDAYEERIDATMKRVDEIPVAAVPRLVVADEVYAPTVDFKETRRALDAAVRGGE
ncbi:DsbA family protein [Halegenticoccus tardaugens]|uniref:DsbA family protein n=1 Tax=Halegenticoccus tardaugens TaxID=2071624 RepID=UPI00100AE7CD|nr:thioredoxin domain-containing protein [Halegenticoccus tardaugens]